MSDSLSRSTELFDKLFDSLSDDEFLEVHNSVELGIGPTIDEFLAIHTNEYSVYNDHDNCELVSSMSVVELKVEFTTDLYAANDSPYYSSTYCDAA